MNVNRTYDVDIISSGMNGEGVARLDGKVLFVPYTLCGERVRVVVKLVKKNYAVGSVVKVLSPSPDRVAPSCPHYFKCGGCDLGHVTNEYREKALVSELRNNLRKIAGIVRDDIEFVKCEATAGVRNKLSMPFGVAEGKPVLGLYRQGTHVVEQVSCEFATPRMKEVADIVCEFAFSRNLPVYDGENGLLRHLVLRELGGRLSATLVINSDRCERWERELGALFPEYVDFFICPNTRRNNVILGDSVRLIRGNERLPLDVLGVKAELSPLAFLQVNDGIRDALYTAAMSFLRGKTLVDLYSGIGITSNLAARRCEKVIAVESVPQAVEDADRTAELNGNSSVIENICGNVEDVVSGLCDRCAGADVLIDPPRKGCGAAVMRAIADMRPERIVYISCNHATMCRDIAMLDGYTLEHVALYDMFPRTHHAETLACFVRNK